MPKYLPEVWIDLWGFFGYFGDRFCFEYLCMRYVCTQLPSGFRCWAHNSVQTEDVSHKWQHTWHSCSLRNSCQQNAIVHRITYVKHKRTLSPPWTWQRNSLCCQTVLLQEPHRVKFIGVQSAHIQVGHDWNARCSSTSIAKPNMCNEAMSKERQPRNTHMLRTHYPFLPFQLSQIGHASWDAAFRVDRAMYVRVPIEFEELQYHERTFPWTETQPKPTSHKCPSSSVYPVNPWTAESDQDIWQTYSCVVVLSLQGVGSSDSLSSEYLLGFLAFIWVGFATLGFSVETEPLKALVPSHFADDRRKGLPIACCQILSLCVGCCTDVVAFKYVLFTTVCSANTGQFFKKAH